ncbi:hypothetical protein CAPTEDRAFT_167969 [Capitella teleta]|uniref:BTB domain-containing protein n=1 Tax=Capitella teleta TaxID=283909 RepID=R7TEF0_CAPTE|nr:hypothetical protein CAPTEDRAFT_167969 [Capitella teleta]|eukprot:ELT89441.1 hypothetical protein CAPTEDRAFT_167969 [Capitella teleta]
MAEENKASDLVLEVAGNKIHCHKVIMAAASPFFKVMLTSGLKESIEGHVKLPGARYDVIRKIVDAVYGQDFVLDSDNVQDALMACHQYGFTLIQERCVQQMLPLVNNENCLGVYILGKKYDIAELKAKAAPHFCDICAERSSNLSHLSAHDWDFIIKRTKFSPSLFQLLIYWVHFDRYARLVALDSIIQQVAITKCDLLRDSLFREICEREKCLLLEANVL